MHVAAMNPQYLDRDSVPADIVTKEKEILAAQIAEEGKPANIVEKIVEGRIGKFFAENCLMEQIFVKDTGDKKTLEAIQTDLVAKIGEKIRVRRFVRFELGEGMEKKNEDFAAEVAKTAGQAN
jgi:elongation factor Ts